MPPISPLRPITQKLNTLPVEELPQYAHFLASSITNCTAVLSASKSHTTAAGGNEDAILVLKFRTRISSLLQDRASQGRWTAVVLVKAVVEAGGWEVLKDCEPWARALVAIIGRPDPISTKKLAVITLTRIFLLTEPYPTLIREMTTPLLPAFVSGCLNLVSQKDSQASREPIKSNSLLVTVLESFYLLLPHHPTTFRPFSSRIHEILLAFLTNPTVSTEAKVKGRELFAVLHYCAAKSAITSEWENACKTLISSTHITADQVFRALLEDWESSDPQRRQKTIKRKYEKVVGSLDVDPLGLPAWEGIDGGSMRIIDLLQLLSTFLSTSTATAVSIPVGLILDLTARLSSVLVPRAGKESASLRHNPEVAREEREDLFLHLPSIHVSTIDLLSNFIDMVQGAGLPVYSAILDQASWIFNAEGDNVGVRDSIFGLVQRLLPHIGSSTTKADIRILDPILKSCARDMLPAETDGPLQNGISAKGKPNNYVTGNADSFLKDAKASKVKSQPHQPSLAAWRLLPAIYHYLPSQLLNQTLRGELDRAAILATHKEALLASTLNPPPVVRGKPTPPSLLPWLGQISGDDLSYEAFLRPRMPVVLTSSKETIDSDEEMDADNIDSTALPDLTGPWQPTTHQQSATLTKGPSPSLLDQLENQLPAETPPITSHSIETPGEFNARLPPSPQKRDFAHLETFNASSPQIMASTSGISQSNTEPYSAKRPKTETDPSPSPRVPAPQQTSELPTTAGSTTIQSANLITENVASTSSITMAPEMMRDQGLVVPASRIENAATEGGDEESDFEIPEINVEPDTDDELEDDEDEDMEG